MKHLFIRRLAHIPLMITQSRKIQERYGTGAAVLARKQGTIVQISKVHLLIIPQMGTMVGYTDRSYTGGSPCKPLAQPTLMIYGKAHPKSMALSL